MQRVILKLQLTAEGLPTLPGVSGPVPLGVRHLNDFGGETDNGFAFCLWGFDIANITAANTPVVNFLTGAFTADGTTVTGTPGLDYEGNEVEPAQLHALVLVVTGALVTATVAGTGLLARLPVGTHLLSGPSLGEWLAAVTFAAPAGTAGLASTAVATAA